MGVRASLVVAVVTGASALLALAGCVPRKNKPPPLRVVALGPALGPGRGCAQQVAGPVVCWSKENGHGQVGDGTREPRLFQTKVAGELGKIAAFAMGSRHTCALEEGGGLHCWGAANLGQLARAPRGNDDVALAPARIPGEGWDLVVAGEAHTCARSAGGVRCWGSGVALEALGVPGKDTVLPVEPPITKGARVTAMAASRSRTCLALERADAKPATVAVQCFGAPFGPGTFLEGKPVTKLAMSETTVCAVLAGGELHCWEVPAIPEGDKAVPLAGEGDRFRIAPSVPTRLDLPEPAVEVGLGRQHGCVRTKSGTVACWGENAYHQLADGTSTRSARPKLIYGLVGAKQLAVSEHGACALLDNGEARCWGGNASGELGDGTTVEHDVPMPIKAAPR